MTTLTIDHHYLISSSAFGRPNNLPSLFAGGNLRNSVDMSEADEDLQRASEYGRVPSIAPYSLQDGYTRELHDGETPVAILENAHLRATFLLGWGGRLWSLVHKATGRELLFTNDRIQLANLALRNAWFAGGVEWNIGTIGHSPGTCEPIHAAEVAHPDGTPVLRLYEFERVREVIYQLDFHLPEDSEVLFAGIRVINPNPHTVPIYWWTNIAVEQTPGTRVLAAADHAWNYSYDEVLRRVPIAEDETQDVSFPARAHRSNDYFFDVESPERPWITAIDESGTGLGHASTPQLRGRKLFIWGDGAGGRRWQEWLSGPGREYIEIQAGLARTQFEHLELSGLSEVAWVEAFGRATVANEVTEQPWPIARRSAEQAIDSLVSVERLEKERTEAEQVARLAPVRILHAGTGWGALERMARETSRDFSLNRIETPFVDSTLSDEQAPWLTLLRDGRLPEADPSALPHSVEVNPSWMPRLVQASGWEAAVHRGNIKAYAGDVVGARVEWEESIALEPSVVAWRNLAALHLVEEDYVAAARLYDQALQMAPGDRALVIEALNALRRAGNSARVLDVIEQLPDELASIGRIRLLRAQAAIAVGDIELCGSLLEPGFELPDLREGDDSLAQLWLAYADAVLERDTSGDADGSLGSIPRHLDFRMQP